ncbi:hypothetical protein Tco_0083524 [Tanacetum coccineum]
MPTTRQGPSSAAIKQSIAQRIAEAMESYKANQNNQNGNGNPNVNVGGVVPVARECPYQDFMKYHPLNFKGTEGVVGLTRWFEKIKTVFHISNCPQKYQALMKLMTEGDDLTAYTKKFQELILLCTKMVLEEEDRVEKFIGGLTDNIQRNVIAAEPTRLQDVIRIANNLIDQKLKGYAARNAENKRRNNNKKGYARILPLYNKCKLHHHSLCPVKCGNCKKVGHQARNGWTFTTVTCYGCGGKGHTKRCLVVDVVDVLCEKSVVTLKPASVEVSDESDPEPAKRQTDNRRSRGVVIQDTPNVPKKKSVGHSQRLKGVSNESTDTFKTSTEGTGIKPGALDEVQGKADVIIIWGSENESDNSEEENVDDEEIEWVSTDEKEVKQDDDNDRSIDLEETNDEDEDDELVYGDEYVHDDVDEVMKDAEDAETGKDDEEIIDAKKTEATKGDYEQAGKLPPTSSSLSVSSGFGNQFLNLSSDSSLIATPTPSLALPIETPVLTVPLPPPIVSAISYVQQQTTPIPTTPITTIALNITTIIPDPLPAIVQRVSKLEKDVQELKQVDHSPTILATIRSHVPAAVYEYLGLSLGDALQKIKQEHAAKEKMPKFSATSYDQAAEAEFKQKEILFKMMRESKSYEKHSKHKALYDSLMLLLIQDEEDLDIVIPNLRKRDCEKDEDPSARSNQGKRKRSSGKDSEPSKTSSASKKTSKGDTPSKSSKTSKSVFTEESVKEATHKDPLTFDELMATPIDFSNFAKNCLKLDKITKEDLVGPVYNLLKGTCQSSIELEYIMEECYKALIEKLNWDNPEGDRCPFNLSKPLPLKGRPDHLTVASEYFFNNDLE